MGIKEIITLSREYGSNPGFVIAGGGNTSYKDEALLYIKASGFALATIDETGFVAMERRKLNCIWLKEYPTEPKAREATALKDLMDSKAEGQEDKRPSVETLLHEAIPNRYIVHTHPALINGLTCGKDGARKAEELFKGKSLWIPIINPGYVLAVTVRSALKKYVETVGSDPDYIFLQNHGVFVSSDTPEGIREKYGSLVASVQNKVTRSPDRSPVADSGTAPTESSRKILQKAFSAVSESEYVIKHHNDREIQSFLRDHSTFQLVAAPFTPDHIVYYGHAPMYFGESPQNEESMVDLLQTYRTEHGVLPKVVAVRGMGIYGCGLSQKAADNAVAMFGDVINIAVYAEPFGGGMPLPREHIDFIRGWEVEHYRAKVSN